jgi:hypothetical protein
MGWDAVARGLYACERVQGYEDAVGHVSGAEDLEGRVSDAGFMVLVLL